MLVKHHKSLALGMVLLSMTSLCLYAQEEEPKSRFSHTGLKAAIASASFDMISERGLDEGTGGALSLGYGFTDRFSLWVTLLGSEHPGKNSDNLMTEFSGIELNIQHKFETESRFQPYGMLGFGLYALAPEVSEATLVGAGINLGVGLDFFFSRHFGIGAELMFKKLDYFGQSVETESGELFTALDPNLNGDTVGFMLSFTIQ